MVIMKILSLLLFVEVRIFRLNSLYLVYSEILAQPPRIKFRLLINGAEDRLKNLKSTLIVFFLITK